MTDATAARTTRTLRLGLVLYPGCMPAGLFAAADMVRACNLRAGNERVAIHWVAAESGPMAVENGPPIQAASLMNETHLDALLLPGHWATSADALDASMQGQRALLDALRRLPRRTQLWSYCAGVPLVAAGGLLDGLMATATWWLQPWLAERYPAVQWQSASTVADGRIVTAAGPGGYLPLLLDRLGGLFGLAVLRDVQNVLVLPHPRQRHPAFEAVEPVALRDAALRELLWFAQKTPAHALDLPCAAAQMKVSVRTLCRRVQDATGLSAGDWLRRIKLSQVGEALRHSRSPLKTICDDLGFSSESSLHRAFRELTGLAPAAYRRAFGEPPPSSEALNRP